MAFKVLVFILRSTFMAFGGGNALFPFMRKEVVDKHKWMTEKEFDKLIITTNMIPGPSVVESLSFIAMKLLGPIKGAIIALIGILPHILFALGLFIIAQEYLPEQYLLVVNVSVMPVIIGVLLAFAWRFIKLSHKEIGFPLMIALIIFTIGFSIFIPTPWNIPAIVMIAVIITTLTFEVIKSKKAGGK